VYKGFYQGRKVAIKVLDDDRNDDATLKKELSVLR
jgi:hypothetical protein